LYLLYTEVGFIKSSKSEVNYDAPTTVRSYLNQGKLRGKKAYGRWFITYEDLTGYIKGF
jgi:hypothetical protein